MKDEIKEIKFDHFKDLEELKQNVENWLATDEMYWERWFGLYDIKTLLDYITNLQTIEQQYSSILSENAELENKITNLQEDLEYSDYCNEQLRKKITNLEYKISLLQGEDTKESEVK